MIKPPTAPSSYGALIKTSAKAALDLTGVNRGWCLVAGARDGSVAEYLAETTLLNIVVVEHDAQRLKAIRARLMKSGLLGSRVIAVDWAYSDLPDYFANLIVSERAMLGDEVYHFHHKMMVKEPRVGGAWEWHQDYGYWYSNN